ncbi:MAG: ABC transporter ATP-binding protein [Gammaproteobacteria bacterium]|nr:ABC transporter ATP-binding protein [Gammaproteobacteria bacterium]NNC97071.1 ABC transporter ATP-binding protein [Gammaproteobacteria bacterium]NNM14333.1 ABC transporter ATP-binding protein [Gammaproteobacteria bacterium]
MQLTIKNLSHAFANKPVLDDINLVLQNGEIGCLLGPSGSGKTTILRCIAGFETPQQGEIYTNSELISSPAKQVDPHKRHIGMMFQDFALLPHLSVANNVAFGLHQLDKKSRQAKVQEVLQVVGLEDMADKHPHQLSGGQQQRVALARAIAPNPRLILMDEPFSNLDVTLRKRLGADIRRILKHYQITALMVTHDQHEAFVFADSIGVIKDGQLQQWDSAYNLYHKPVNRFVANFVGQGSFVNGRVTNKGTVIIELGELHGQISTDVEPEQIVDVLLRPDDVIHDDDSPVTAIVLHKAFRGADILYTLALESGATVLSLVPSHHDHALGEPIGIRLEADHIVAFKK